MYPRIEGHDAFQVVAKNMKGVAPGIPLIRDELVKDAGAGVVVCFLVLDEAFDPGTVFKALFRQEGTDLKIRIDAGVKAPENFENVGVPRKQWMYCFVPLPWCAAPEDILPLQGVAGPLFGKKFSACPLARRSAGVEP